MMELASPQAGPARHPWPRVLVSAAYVLVGVSLGLVIGFWAADWGAHFFPQLAIAALSALSAAFALLSSALWLEGRRFGLRARVAACAALTAVVAVGGVLLMERPAPLTDMAAIDLRRVQELDTTYYRDLDRTLRGLVQRFRSEFGPPVGEDSASSLLLTSEEEAFALDTWESYLDTAMALDRLRRFHEDFYRFDLSRSERAFHVKSFLLAFACELSLYQNTNDLMDVIRSRPSLRRFLNLPRPQRGIAADSVAFVDEELTGVTDLSRVSTGKRYLSYLAAFHEGRALAMGDGTLWLWNDVEHYVAGVEAGSTRRAVASATQSDFAPILRKLKHLSFPVQREVAAFMGDTRLKRAGHYLITAEQAHEAEIELAPGDVLLARKNWYLSNVGLPGFWPHAILYVGTPESLARAFDDDPAVREWVRGRSGRPIAFTEWLAETYPLAWSQKLRAAESDDPLTLIEAVSEGVVQSSLAGSAGDFLVALRPRLTATVKARAIERAFSFLNRPYDFDFDFATDDALVCTEVVWRAYREGSEFDGLRIEPVTIAGRATLPANELARLFVAEHGRADAQFDFVFYFEGDEALGTARSESLDRFRETVERSKWGG